MTAAADFDAFAARVAAGGDGPLLVPVWRDVVIDADTPVAAFAKLRRGGDQPEPFAFLLESAPAGGATWARYTYMGVAPRGAWRLRDGLVQDWDRDRGWHADRRPADPLADLEERLTRYRPAGVPDLGQFWSGAVGYGSYDLVRHIERLPAPPPRGVDAPDALFVFTNALVIIDSLLSQARVVVGVEIEDRSAGALRPGFDAAIAEIDRTVARLRTGPSLGPLVLRPDIAPAEGRSTYSREAFCRAVDRIREYIVAGDAFQVLLSRRVIVPADFSSEALYRVLRVINPSPYMYHLDLDGVELVGSSPELLVRAGAGTVTVRPIAGTRPRGRTAQEDAAMAADLLADEKERAEHVMLVDLGRNDVGRLARYGTVAVTDFMTVERYSHVLHLVSQVDGRLRDGLTAMDALRATFPAGTMTGAPKVRAMEIIDELEPERRGPYAGAVGYISAGASWMDLAITIRTCVIAGGEASVQAGAGVVHDSVPEREWQETENKARAALIAIAHARSQLPG